MDLNLEVSISVDNLEELAEFCSGAFSKLARVKGSLTVSADMRKKPASFGSIESVSIPVTVEPAPIVEKVAPEEQEEHVPVPAAALFGGITVETLAPDEQPKPMPTTSHVDHEVDSAGVIWDPAIHAGQPGKAKPKRMDGTWKARRGTAKKAPTNAGGGVAMTEVDAVLGKLIAHGLTADEINGPVSQAVFKDLTKTTGGMEHVRASNDPAVNEKALNSLRAIAAARNIQL